MNHSEPFNKIEPLTTKGRTTIFASLGIAILSMFIGCEQLFIISWTGIKLEKLLLLIFWAYPVFISIFNLKMSIKWGGRIGILNILTTSIIILSLGSHTRFGFSTDIGIGAWFYLLSALLLYIGITQYNKNYTLYVANPIENPVVMIIEKPEPPAPVILYPKPEFSPPVRTSRWDDWLDRLFPRQGPAPSQITDDNFEKLRSVFEEYANNLQSQFDATVTTLQDQFESRLNDLREQLEDSQRSLQKYEDNNRLKFERLELGHKAALRKISLQVVTTLTVVILSLVVTNWPLIEVQLRHVGFLS